MAHTPRLIFMRALFGFLASFDADDFFGAML